MLKIKDDVKFEQLAQFGFEKKYYYNAIVLEAKDRRQDIVFDLKTRKLDFCNFSYDTLFDLIQAGLIEKVEEE